MGRVWGAGNAGLGRGGDSGAARSGQTPRLIANLWVLGKQVCYRTSMALRVVYHPGYEAEWRDLPPAERAALASAVEKLRADSQLGFPHTSLVRGSQLGIRELRPRRGRSRWRALYRRVGEVMVVLAVAPEAGCRQAWL